MPSVWDTTTDNSGKTGTIWDTTKPAPSLVDKAKDIATRAGLGLARGLGIPTSLDEFKAAGAAPTSVGDFVKQLGSHLAGPIPAAVKGYIDNITDAKRRIDQGDVVGGGAQGLTSLLPFLGMEDTGERGSEPGPGTGEIPALTHQEAVMKSVTDKKSQVVPGGGDPKYRAAQQTAVPQLKAQEPKVGPITIANKDAAYSAAASTLDKQLDAYHNAAVARGATGNGDTIADAKLAGIPLTLQQDAARMLPDGVTPAIPAAAAKYQSLVDEANSWRGQQIPVEDLRQRGRSISDQLSGYYKANDETKAIMVNQNPDIAKSLAEQKGIQQAYREAVDPGTTDANGNPLTTPGANIATLGNRYADLITSRQREDLLDKKIAQTPPPSILKKVLNLGEGAGLTVGGVTSAVHGNPEGAFPIAYGVDRLTRGLASTHPLADGYAAAYRMYNGPGLDPVPGPPDLITPKLTSPDQGYKLTPGPENAAGNFSVQRSLLGDQSTTPTNPLNRIENNYSDIPKNQLDLTPTDRADYARQLSLQDQTTTPTNPFLRTENTHSDIPIQQLLLTKPSPAPTFEWQKLLAPESSEVPTEPK